MRKLYKSMVAATFMTATLLTPLQAEAQSSASNSTFTETINQGDKIMMGGSACTAGYIDKSKNVMITAAHCGSPGDIVYKEGPFGTPIRIGVMEGNKNYDGNINRNDFTYVKLDRGVTGENIYSGDKRITPQDVSVGDRFCSIGQKSPVVKCGVVKNVDGNLVVTNREGGGIKGDSGGPGWIPGKGFFGVYSIFWGQNEYPSQNHRFNGTAFTYPEYSDKNERVHLDTGRISFPAPMIQPPNQAQPVTPVPERNTPVPTTKTQPSPRPIPQTNIQTPPTPPTPPTPIQTPPPIKKDDGLSTSAIVGIFLGTLAILGIGTTAYNIYQETPQAFDINYWIKKYFTF